MASEAACNSPEREESCKIMKKRHLDLLGPKAVILVFLLLSMLVHFVILGVSDTITRRSLISAFDDVEVRRWQAIRSSFPQLSQNWFLLASGIKGIVIGAQELNISMSVDTRLNPYWRSGVGSLALTGDPIAIQTNRSMMGVALFSLQTQQDLAAYSRTNRISPPLNQTGVYIDMAVGAVPFRQRLPLKIDEFSPFLDSITPQNSSYFMFNSSKIPGLDSIVTLGVAKGAAIGIIFNQLQFWQTAKRVWTEQLNDGVICAKNNWGEFIEPCEGLEEAIENDLYWAEVVDEHPLHWTIIALGHHEDANCKIAVNAVGRCLAITLGITILLMIFAGFYAIRVHRNVAYSQGCLEEQARFMALTSHDMRTPIQIISSAAALGKGATSMAEISELLEEAIQPASTVLAYGMQNIMDANSTEIELSPSPCDLREVVLGALRLVRVTAEISPFVEVVADVGDDDDDDDEDDEKTNKRIVEGEEVVSEAGSNSNTTTTTKWRRRRTRSRRENSSSHSNNDDNGHHIPLVMVDGQRLRRCVMHLLTNAFEHTRQGKVVLKLRIKVITEAEESENESKDGMIQPQLVSPRHKKIQAVEGIVEVQDSGMGIHPESLEKIKESFRVRSTPLDNSSSDCDKKSIASVRRAAVDDVRQRGRRLVSFSRRIGPFLVESVKTLSLPFRRLGARISHLRRRREDEYARAASRTRPIADDDTNNDISEHYSSEQFSYSSSGVRGKRTLDSNDSSIGGGNNNGKGNLRTVSNILSSMNSELHIDSQLGVGTKVSFRVRLDPAPLLFDEFNPLLSYREQQEREYQHHGFQQEQQEQQQEQQRKGHRRMRHLLRSKKRKEKAAKSNGEEDVSKTSSSHRSRRRAAATLDGAGVFASSDHREITAATTVVRPVAPSSPAVTGSPFSDDGGSDGDLSHGKSSTMSQCKMSPMFDGSSSLNHWWLSRNSQSNSPSRPTDSASVSFSKAGSQGGGGASNNSNGSDRDDNLSNTSREDQVIKPTSPFGEQDALEDTEQIQVRVSQWKSPLPLLLPPLSLPQPSSPTTVERVDENSCVVENSNYKLFINFGNDDDEVEEVEASQHVQPTILQAFASPTRFDASSDDRRSSENRSRRSSCGSVISISPPAISLLSPAAAATSPFSSSIPSSLPFPSPSRKPLVKSASFLVSQGTFPFFGMFLIVEDNALIRKLTVRGLKEQFSAEISAGMIHFAEAENGSDAVHEAEKFLAKISDNGGSNPSISGVDVSDDGGSDRDHLSHYDDSHHTGMDHSSVDDNESSSGDHPPYVVSSSDQGGGGGEKSCCNSSNCPEKSGDEGESSAGEGFTPRSGFFPLPSPVPASPGHVIRRIQSKPASEICSFKVVALLDINMPVMDGVEAATIMKRRWPKEVLRMAYTARSEFGEEEGKEGGLFEKILFKPCKADVLAKEIRECMKRKCTRERSE